MEVEAPETTPIPAVVAVVVAQGHAEHLEACLGALIGSDYPDLTVLVIAATDEDLTPRVAAVAPAAFVRAVADPGFAQGANEALATVAGAPFLLFCHADTVCDPNAIRVLVEEAYRSNAAIVGPKVVDVDRPEILREVGWSVDRFGVPHSEIERDELDQEQHDAVRDVFFVSDVCMLVRADLFGELGGFDVECDPGARELDLCWRARLAAARVIVAPDARVGHYEEDGPGESDRRLTQRHRVRALLTNTSGARLLWIAPTALVIQLVEAIALLVRRRRSRAAELWGAWTWNLRTLPSLRTARRRSQSARVVPDREIHSLQFRGSARVSTFMTTSLHAEDRARVLSQRGRSIADSAGNTFRSLRGIVLLAFLAVALIGGRDLVIGRVAAVGQFAPWPGVGDLTRAFTSEWRFADLGAHSPAPPLLALVAGLRILTLGAGDLARTMLVVGAIPVGAFGVHRIGRLVAGAGWPAACAAIAYGIVPIPRNAIATGRLGSLVLYALAPWVLLALLQVGGMLPSRWPRRRIAILGGLAEGIAVAFWPVAIVLPFLLLVGIVLMVVVTRDAPARLGSLAWGTAVVTGLAVLLLFPWPLGFVGAGDRLASLGIVFEPAGSVGSLLRFVTGPNGGGIGTWAFIVVGVAVTVITTGERSAWCVRLWGIALVSWLVAILPSWLQTRSPAVEGLLVPAALALALIVGIGVATFSDEVRRHGLGWRHAVALLSALTMTLAVLTFLGDAVGGRWHQPSDDWNESLSWMRLQRDRGPFRVLWLGRADVVPGSAHRGGVDAFALTNNGPGDLVDLLPPPGGASITATRRAVAQLRHQDTSRFGALMRPMAVRYVAVPDRADPGPTNPSDTDAGLAAGLSQQLDLRQLEVASGLRLYENTAWTPGGPVALTPRGTFVWSQTYSDAWRARTAGHSLAHHRVFGWTNGFTASRAGPVAVTFEQQWWRWPALVIELGIVVALARRALRRGRRARRRTRATAEKVPV